MKNAIIGILAVLVILAGGWIVYDKLIKDDSYAETFTSSSTSPSNSATNSTSNSGATIDMSNKGLTKVGPDIYEKTNTTVLILSNNQLTSLPSEMGKMTKLEVLKLNNNILEGSLIAEIRKMSLVELDVSNNNMTGVPAEIGQLSKLQTLNYSNNKITDFPNEIANLKNSLKVLNVSGNPLTQDTINKLKSSLPNTTITL